MVKTNMMVYDEIDYTKFTNPKTLETEVSQGLTEHVESFLKIVLPNTYYELGFYDDPEGVYTYRKYIFIVIEWDETIDQMEMIMKLKTGMTLVDYIEHWSQHNFTE